MLTYILFVIGFVILIYGANWLVNGASSLAKRFNVSDLVIGLTVVAFGTSAPELAVNIFAGSSGNTDIAIGNILGSNIFNILLILGVAATIHPLTVQKNTIFKEIPFSLLAAIVLAISVNDAWLDDSATNIISRSDGLIFLSFFIIFMFYTYESAKSVGDSLIEEEIQHMALWKSIGLVVAGIAGLVLGGKFIVDGAVKIATQLGMSEAMIGLTIVAAGTSLPELATSAVAAYKKNADIAIGNVVGSNIFNILLVLGVTSTITPLPFSNSSNLDIMMVIFSSLLLFIFTFTGRKKHITRFEGIIFLILFVLYMGYAVVSRI